MAPLPHKLSVLSLFLLSSVRSYSALSNNQKHATRVAFCPSNHTHIGWLSPPSLQECVHVTREKAELECLEFLRQNMFSFDVPLADSLGLSNSMTKDVNDAEESVRRRRLAAVDETTETETMALPDGLSDGIVQDTIALALDTKAENYWTQMIPKDMFMEYVLPFANVDEARNNWRPLLKEALAPTVKHLKMIRIFLDTDTVVDQINKDLWKSFTYVNNGEPIVFKAGQTPRIYDPMSVILYGRASCTGLSILLVDALRAVGVPARIAGTPAWNGNVDNGNHSWVEFYSDMEQKWKFLEPIVDMQKNDPCKYWFCNKKHFDGKTKVYAAKMVKTEDGTYFPMSWDASNQGVPGEDRSEEMNAICSQC